MQSRDLYLIVTAYLLVITCAELLTAYLTKAGIALHAVILFTLLVHAASEAGRNKHLSHFLMALVLAPLIRILSLSMPATIFSRISWFLIVSIPLFIATVVCIVLQALQPEDVGLFTPHRKHIPLEASVIILAVPFGILEYHILKPAPLPMGSQITNVIVASLILVLCTGFLEELAFRGVIQANAIQLMSKWRGILIVSTIFGVLHIGNLALLDCLLAFSVGFIYSVVREQTGSIYGISISHGIINIILFLVAPGYY